MTWTGVFPRLHSGEHWSPGKNGVSGVIVLPMLGENATLTLDHVTDRARLLRLPLARIYNDRLSRIALTAANAVRVRVASRNSGQLESFTAANSAAGSI